MNFGIIMFESTKDYLENPKIIYFVFIVSFKIFRFFIVDLVRYTPITYILYKYIYIQWRNAMRAFDATAPPLFLKKENSILLNE